MELNVKSSEQPIYVDGKKISSPDWYISADATVDTVGQMEDDFKAKQAAEKAAGTKYFSKEREAERHAERKAERKADGGFFKHLLKDIKRDARKLFHKKNKAGKDVYADAIPVATVGADGTAQKITGDGSTVKIDPANLTAWNPVTGATKPATPLDFKDNKTIVFDKTDVTAGKPLQLTTNSVTNAPAIETHHTEGEVTHVENGDVYKVSDSVQEGFGGATKGGMSKGMKIGLIVGGVVLLAVGYMIYKSKHKK